MVTDDLVHDPAGRADDLVLGFLAQRRETQWLDRACAERASGRHFERSTRRHAHRDGDVGRDRQPRPWCVDHAVAHEHDGHADHVVRPPGQSAERVAHLRIGEGCESVMSAGDKDTGPTESASSASATTVVVRCVATSSTRAPE